MMSNAYDTHPRDNSTSKFTGYHMLASMVAFFAVIMVANFTMAWFASSSWTGLVVKNGYVASQHFNERLEAARLQQARGWKSLLSASEGIIKLEIRDKKDNPVVLKDVQAKFSHPVSQELDTHLKLVNIGPGIFQSTGKLPAGVWVFTVESSGEKPFRLEGRMTVGSDGKGAVL